MLANRPFVQAMLGIGSFGLGAILMALEVRRHGRLERALLEEPSTGAMKLPGTAILAPLHVEFNIRRQPIVAWFWATAFLFAWASTITLVTIAATAICSVMFLLCVGSTYRVSIEVSEGQIRATASKLRWRRAVWTKAISGNALVFQTETFTNSDGNECGTKLAAIVDGASEPVTFLPPLSFAGLWRPAPTRVIIEALARTLNTLAATHI